MDAGYGVSSSRKESCVDGAAGQRGCYISKCVVVGDSSRTTKSRMMSKDAQSMEMGR